MKGAVVVDASVAVKWLISEAYSDKAFALGRSWAKAGVQPVAPYLMLVEVANALHKRVARAELSSPGAARLLGGLASAGIDLREPEALHTRAVEMAGQLRQSTVYDTHYLALAETLACELWTADERFFRAASPTFSDVRRLADFDAGTKLG